MKHSLLFLLTLAPCIAFGQMTYVPDDVLEEELEGFLFDNDNYVLTSTVEGKYSLFLDGNDGQISDFTGLEDAINLTSFYIDNMTVPTLQLVGVVAGSLNFRDNLSSTLQLDSVTIDGQLWFQNNLCSNITFDNCTFGSLYVYGNPLVTGIDFQNTNSLISGSGAVTVYDNNSLQAFDFSNVNMLTAATLTVQLNTSLSQLNLKNGQCILWNQVGIGSNPSLFCVQVDDPSYCELSTVWYWGEQAGDPSTYSYSTDCGYPVGIEEPPTKDKHLLYITDILGRTTLTTPNTLLFYIYDDGSVEKKIQLER